MAIVAVIVCNSMSRSHMCLCAYCRKLCPRILINCCICHQQGFCLRLSLFLSTEPWICLSFACKVPIKCYYSKMKTIRLRPANIFVINYPFRQSPVLSLFSLNSLFVFVWAFFSSSILFRILFGCHLFCVYKLLQGY